MPIVDFGAVWHLLDAVVLCVAGGIQKLLCVAQSDELFGKAPGGHITHPPVIRFIDSVFVKDLASSETNHFPLLLAIKVVSTEVIFR